MTDYEFEKTLHETLLNIKPPRLLKGFYQLKYTLQLIIENEYTLGPLNKDIFPAVADKFKCSPETIERNIRSFIKHIDRAKFEDIVGCPADEHITVKNFIYILIEHLQIKMSQNVIE